MVLVGAKKTVDDHRFRWCMNGLPRVIVGGAILLVGAIHWWYHSISGTSLFAATESFGGAI